MNDELKRLKAMRDVIMDLYLWQVENRSVSQLLKRLDDDLLWPTHSRNSYERSLAYQRQITAEGSGHEG